MIFITVGITWLHEHRLHQKQLVLSPSRNFMRHLLSTTLAIAVLSSAHAAPLTTTQSATIAPVFSITADTTEGSSAVVSSINRALSFGKFDADMGVLTGISSKLTFSAGSAFLFASGTQHGHYGTPSFASQAIISAASSLPGLSAFGAVNQTLSNSCRNAATCFPHGISHLLFNPRMIETDATWLSPTASVAPGSLNNYVGTGALASTFTTTTSVSLQNEDKVQNGAAILKVLGLKGNQSLTYSYLRHANASFTAASDTNALGSLGTGAFSVFNLGDSATTKLDFVSLQCISGNCDAFNVTLASFQDLAAGGSVGGTTALTANLAGDYAATYELVFSDDTSIGATGTHVQNSLLLNVNGSVPAVPEPSNWALLSLGLIGLVAFRRRKQ
jgi:hypothetical protein